jgi:uncharacterized protein YggT (Ycf19 family)
MIRLFIEIYIYLIVFDAILSFFPQVQDQKWVRGLRKIADYTLKPIRQALPPDLPIDPSPIIVILLLNLLKVLW